MFFSARRPGDDVGERRSPSTSSTCRPATVDRDRGVLVAADLGPARPASSVAPWPRMKPSQRLGRVAVGVERGRPLRAPCAAARRRARARATSSTVATIRRGVPVDADRAVRQPGGGQLRGQRRADRVDGLRDDVRRQLLHADLERQRLRRPWRHRRRRLGGGRRSRLVRASRISGKPSSSRRSIHSVAVSRMRRRIVANALARSVVEIAPRESSTLKAWLDLRMK